MPVDAKYIADCALDYANVPKIDRRVLASVHLESSKDELFWDVLLQHNRKGTYNYIFESRVEKEGLLIKGVDQCLQYKPYLCNTFFICIDSDLRYLLQEPEIDAKHYILQTYTYSWENHFCVAEQIQQRLTQILPKASFKFNFATFLREFSHNAYEPLLCLLEAINKQIAPANIRGLFRSCIPSQCTASVFEDNGARLLSQINHNFHQFQSNPQFVCIDIMAAKEKYTYLGLNENNTYLHLRGHNIWGLLNHLGIMLCKPYHVSFREQVLIPSLQLTGYWQVEKIEKDIQSIV